MIAITQQSALSSYVYVDAVCPGILYMSTHVYSNCLFYAAYAFHTVYAVYS